MIKILKGFCFICDKCGEESFILVPINNGTSEAKKMLENEGWDIRGNNCFCSKCSKLSLKLIKK